MDDIRQQEYEATRLIQEERFDEAVALLEAVLRQDADNVNAWWLMANAVDTPEDARAALTRVLDLNPSHAKARGMLDRLNQLYPQPLPPEPTPRVETPEPPSEAPWGFEEEPPPEVREPAGIAEESPAEALTQMGAVEDPFAFETSAFDRPEAPTGPADAEPTGRRPPSEEALATAVEAPPMEALPPEAPHGEPDEALFAFEEDIFADEGEIAEDTFFEELEAEEAAEAEEPAARKGGCRLLTLLLFLLLAIIVVSGVVTVWVLLRDRPSIPAGPTADPVLATLNENHVGALTGAGRALEALGFAFSGARFERTEAGPALIGVFCWQISPGLVDTVHEAMRVVTEQAVLIDEGLEALGVEMVRCDDISDVVYSAVTTVGQAADYYINQDSTEADFRATWLTGP